MDSHDTGERMPKGAGASAALSHYAPPYRHAGIAGLAIFLLYVITLAPTTAFWDTSEYIATAHIVGIPHPPGNPVFVLLARAWELLLAPLPLSPAVKINLFSAANGGVAAAFWFLVIHRVMAFFSDDERFRLLGAAATTLISATAFTVWNQSVVNEKVYTVSLMTIALLTWLIFRWRDNLGKGKDDNLLILIVFLLALSLGNHLMAFLVAPAMVFFVIWSHPRVLFRWRLYAFAALAWILGLSAQLFLPVRAENRPIISEADPRCESLVDATVDILRLHPPLSLLGQDEENDRCAALSESLRRTQYRKPPLNVNPIFYPREVPRDLDLLRWQFINYAQYFDWQWARSLDGANTFFAWVRAPFTLLFLLLGLYGAWRHFYADRTSWVYFAALFVTVWFGLVYYLNFKYGYSVAATIDPGTGELMAVPREWREVRERDYFFIVSFSQWGLWAGIGLAALWQTLAKATAGAADRISFDHYRRTVPILALALLPLLLNWKYASRAGDYAARDWAYNLLMSVEPYAVVFTNGDNDTFPLWYLQEVEGLRRDVIVIVYSYLATPWYAQQLRDLSRPCDGIDPLTDPTVITCQRPFEPEAALPIYQGREWAAPTRSILELSDAEIQQIPDCFPRDERTGACQAFADSVPVPIGDIDGLIVAGDYLWRNDIMVLRILQTTAGDRPVYFASTTGTYERWNIQPWMIRQGVAFKVVPTEIRPTTSLVPIPTNARARGGRLLPFWLDIDRTADLMNEHYIFRDLTERTFWPDLSTNGIPLQYYSAYVALATAQMVLGQGDLADQSVAQAQQFLVVALGPEFLAPAQPSDQAPPRPEEVPTDSEGSP
ncbi:MAG: DUF2723 domain-containing protein [Gemmatimonadetes bacterium]|nr:DUF2723 domain-containing protein [Gemmatimonadota bacterium]NIO32114.1 DUF2723 domain-containing protein [Gemmatimonadota bacterium]